MFLHKNKYNPSKHGLCDSILLARSTISMIGIGEFEEGIVRYKFVPDVIDNRR